MLASTMQINIGLGPPVHQAEARGKHPQLSHFAPQPSVSAFLSLRGLGQPRSSDLTPHLGQLPFTTQILFYFFLSFFFF